MKETPEGLLADPMCTSKGPSVHSKCGERRGARKNAFFESGVNTRLGHNELTPTPTIPRDMYECRGEPYNVRDPPVPNGSWKDSRDWTPKPRISVSKVVMVRQTIGGHHGHHSRQEDLS